MARLVLLISYNHSQYEQVPNFSFAGRHFDANNADEKQNDKNPSRWLQPVTEQQHTDKDGAHCANAGPNWIRQTHGQFRRRFGQETKTSNHPDQGRDRPTNMGETVAELHKRRPCHLKNSCNY